jgi:hypothetical protein
MNPHRRMTRFMATVLVVATYAALTVASVGCGSNKNSTTTTTTAVVASFTPDTPTPADGSITLLQGTTSGASVNVRVTVTQVANFFGAGFRIKYDPTALLFNGMDSSTSLLNAGVTDTSQLFFLADSANTPGEIVITATRFPPATPLPAAPTADLVILNFVARLAIAPAATVGRLDFGDPAHNQVCDGTVAPPDCGAITVTWSGGGVSAQ